MSNIPITSLPITNPLTGDETVPIVQAGTTKRTTTGAISALPFGQGSTFASGISFVTVGSSFGLLPSSRVLAAASPVTLTDSGTSAPITIGVAFISEVTVTTATYTILPTDGSVYVNRAGTATLTMPAAAAWLAAVGHVAPFQLLIQDVSGSASVNNITINRAGADTMNGLTSITITSDYGGYKLRSAASGLWVIQ